MGWSIGYDDNWKRDIGYGVPAYCDEPGCGKKIDRGLSYVCADNDPYGGENGCGLYFCGTHIGFECRHDDYTPVADHPEWIRHKLTDPSWEEWRLQNQDWVKQETGRSMRSQPRLRGIGR